MFGTKFPVNIEFESFAVMKKIAWSTFLKMRGVIFLKLWSSGIIFVLARKRLSKISPFWDDINQKPKQGGYSKNMPRNCKKLGKDKKVKGTRDVCHCFACSPKFSCG